MKPASSAEIKKALAQKSNSELLEVCLRLARFKKENKELLTYLLFDQEEEESFRMEVKNLISSQFNEMNTNTYYYIKKSVRKILRLTKKYIRYSGEKQTEVELLLHFCKELSAMNPPYTSNTTLRSLMIRQIQIIKTSTKKVHEDIQYDIQKELELLAPPNL
jgi:hypothetical protein